MLNRPLVTILMPCYRKFENVYVTLDSVLEQNYPNYELIVADDGSENFPCREITEYINNHATSNLKRVLIYSNEKNLGIVKNCNRAIKKSKGKYIIPISPDDAYYDKDVVSSVVEAFQISDAFVVTSKQEMITEDGIRTGKIWPDESTQCKIRTLRPLELFEEMLKCEVLIAGGGTYYDRKCFEIHKLFDERFTHLEDLTTFWQISQKQEKIYFLDKLTFLYRTGGISSHWPRVLIDDFQKAYEYIGYPYVKDYIKNLIDPQKKQVIYGTGNESVRILSLLRYENIKPLCHIVSDGFSTKNAKSDYPVYHLSDFPFGKDEVQVLVSEIQTDAESIICNLNNQSFSVTVINNLSLCVAYGIYFAGEDIVHKE